MKIIAAIMLLIASFQIKSNKPEIVVANPMMNILYRGVHNELEALIENTGKKDILLKTDNGTIKKTADNKFTITPESLGHANIKIYKRTKESTILINTINFYVEEMPIPAKIGNLKGGHIKKKFLIAQGGVMAGVECCGIDLPIQIIEYSLIVIRDSSNIDFSNNTGPRYNSKSTELLTSLKQNDKLIVGGIVARLPEQTMPLKPLEFIIDEQ